MAHPFVSLTFQDGVAVITIDRAGKHNALDQTTAEQLARACESAVTAAGVRAVLLRAEGRNFCVGGDVAGFSGEGDRAAATEGLARRLHEVVWSLSSAPVPVIAAVQGAAAGIGLSLAACADLVVAARSASFVMAYSGIGLTPDGGATWLLPRLIGLRRTQVMAFTNRRITASEAEDWGLVSEVCNDDDLPGRSLTLARELAAGPTSAFAALKRLLEEADAADFPSQLDREAREMGRSLARADGAEGVAAFLARRPALYPGV